ncbi:MAG: NupC/NupG family nucleoside CNT transporter [Pyrinomonas methylaliphatogenes]|nr:NupC/NupG family nucleoside CNT transporter [Pyrinomonas methylaliphatogenes]MBX5478773.1 NupC/NupG family nucleoside CNT transporter [Pyrinomonas methylaliphatogenes]
MKRVFVNLLLFFALLGLTPVYAQTTNKINAIAFADDEHGLMVGANGLIRRTEDGGKSWTDLAGPIQADWTGVALNGPFGLIIGRSADGRARILLSDDGGRTWREVEAGASADGRLYAVAFAGRERAFIVGETSDGRGLVIRSDDGGKNWQRKQTSAAHTLRGVWFVDRDNGWVVGDGGQLLHTRDGGETWQLEGARDDTTNHIAAFALDAERAWVVGANGDVHRTADGGASWERRRADGAKDLIAVRFLDANRGYALADDGALWRTSDGGGRWEKANVVWPVAAVAISGGHLVIANAQGQTSAFEASGPAAATATPAKTIHEVLRENPPPLSTRLIGLLGIITLLAILFLLSNDRRAIRPRVIFWGFSLQIVFALLILRTRIGFALFDRIGKGVSKLLAFSDEGARFVFGRLADPSYIEALSRNMPDAAAFVNRYGIVFAFKILPTIIFVASLFAILYYLGIMQRVVYAMAVVMARTMRTSGAESLSTAANVFMGQTEAPLVVAPYVKSMTMSELMTVMTSGMAHISGGVMAAYIGLGIDPVFLLTASVMTAPASMMVAKIMYPEKEKPETLGVVRMNMERTDVNVIDAAARGASDGMRLAINVAAMLIAFIALIALINALLGWIGSVTGINNALGRPFNLEFILGAIFAPLTFLMGVPWRDAMAVGDLLGTKLVLNEFVAYLKLSPLGGNVQGMLQPRSILIATYALCGFANFSSIGIQIGGIGSLAPNRRSDLARLGFRALIGGFIATCLTATLAGILI